MLQEILSHYLIDENAAIVPFGSGLINTTWKVIDDQREYILQKINDKVFGTPELIAENTSAISKYLFKKQKNYLFVTPVKTRENQLLVHISKKGYFRLFPFIKGSHTINVAQKEEQAFEAAKQFGLFTKMLSGFPVQTLHYTLPDFHNLSLRYRQFETALLKGNKNRIKQAEKEIESLLSYVDIVTTYEKMVSSDKFKLRVTHHDTKISNVLFDDNDRGLCVIDLDTVMPGYFVSDVGDMLRTYLSPVSEEEADLDAIVVRDEYFEAIMRGYLSEMHGELNKIEMEHLVYSGSFLIYMQAIRFLTDHLNDDAYYGAAYEGQNYVRSKNQLRLLQQFLSKEALFKTKVIEILKSYR